MGMPAPPRPIDPLSFDRYIKKEGKSSSKIPDEPEQKPNWLERYWPLIIVLMALLIALSPYLLVLATLIN